MTNIEPGDAFSETLTRFGVTIVPTKRRRRPGETHAGGVLRQIVAEHGVDVAALTIALIRGSERNAEALSSETIGALADVLAQRPDWHDRRDELAQAVDRIDLEAMRARAVALRPWPVRLSLRASLYVRMETLVDRLNGPAAWDIAA